MKQQGVKKPDTLDFALPMQNKIDEQYKVSYIQDVVDTEYLQAVYPMQLSCLDEGGYNQDPTDPADSRFVKVDIDKFKGHYALQFLTARTDNADFTTGQGVAVLTANTNKIDISGQFDINIWFTPDATQLRDGTDEPILWGFLDSGNSGSHGIHIGIVGTNGNNSSWRVFVRYNKGGGSQTLPGSSELIMNTLTNQSTTRNMPCHIRVKRDSDNLLKAFVNGVEDISQSVTGTLQPSNTSMTFGDAWHQDESEYKGTIHEVKVYCGSTLSDKDAGKVRVTKPIVQYMKFNGSVVKIKNKQMAKTIFCQSNSYTLTTSRMGTSYGGTVISHALSSTSFKTIAQSAVTNTSPDSSMNFTIRNVDSFAKIQEVFALAGNIYEVGSPIEFLSILLSYSDCIMYITPRKNIIIETNLGHNTGTLKDPSSAADANLFVFDQNSTVSPYNITTNEINDTKVVSQVILVGRGNVTYQNGIQYVPPDGIKRTLRRSVRQLDNSNDIGELGYKILIERFNLGVPNSTLGFPKERYTVNSVAPIHHIRFNHRVQIKRKNGNNSNVSGLTNNDLNVKLNVSQIEWNYPSGLTIINVGEYSIDFYEDMLSLGKSTDDFIDTTL